MVVLLQKHKFTLQKNAFNKKNYSGHAEYFLHFVWKNLLFFKLMHNFFNVTPCGGGVPVWTNFYLRSLYRLFGEQSDGPKQQVGLFHSESQVLVSVVDWWTIRCSMSQVGLYPFYLRSWYQWWVGERSDVPCHRLASNPGIGCRLMRKISQKKINMSYSDQQHLV